MKRTDAYKAAILAVINSELPEDEMFDTLCVLFADHANAKWSEDVMDKSYDDLLRGGAATKAGDEQ